nr:MAG: hypothetical protein [Lokiarchaeota virus Ratatoskr Meg22_1012]
MEEKRNEKEIAISMLSNFFERNEIFNFKISDTKEYNSDTNQLISCFIIEMNGIEKKK